MRTVFEPDKHHRRSIRLKGYDYTQTGAYFVTICTKDGEGLFGEVVDGEMRLNPFGEIARKCWQEIPAHFSRVELDEFVIMPNHIHGIVWIVDGNAIVRTGHGIVGTMHPVVGATHASPLRNEPRGPKPHSIGAIIGSFKSAVTKRIDQMRKTPGAPVWQRNYYEHIIRTERALIAIRRYVAENPLRWPLDRENPDAIGPDPLAHEIWKIMQTEMVHGGARRRRRR